MPIATRLANTGSLLVNNGGDEVSMVAGSISFNGTSQYLITPVNTGFDMGTGDFTIECFVINLGYSGSQYGRGLFAIYPGASYNQRFTVRMNLGSNVMNMYAYNGTTAYLGNSGTNGTALLSDSTKWYHIAVVRQSGVFRLYVNGVQDIIVSNQTSESLPTSCVIEVGRNQDGTVPYWNGLISNFRVVKGTAVYTGPFTPPQAILPAITNTQLLLNVINSTNFITDSSPNALTLTNNGTASFTASSPFGINTTGSISFSNKYLTLPSNQIQFSMATGDWTFECWVNITSLAATRTIYDTVNGGDGTGTGRFSMQISTGGVIQLFTGAGSIFTSGGTLVVSTWYHIAYVKISNSGKLYLNGTQVNTTYTDNNTYVVGTTSRPVIGINGYDLSSNPMIGFISNLRVVKGTGVYTAAFTPAGPLYPITNTSFLLNVTSSASLVLDSSLNNFTVTNSGATFAASRPSTGFLLPQQRVTSSGTMEVTDQIDEVTLATGSLFFNGTSQYLSVPNINFSTNPYTIEGWFYIAAASVPSNINFWGTDNGSGVQPKMILVADSTQFQLLCNNGSSADIIVNHGGLAVNTWHHIAVVKEGTSANQQKIYLNGVALNSTSTAWGSLSSITATFNIGYIGEAFGSVFQGYISNFRIVNGTALYTAAFTPPQSILPAVANTSLLLNMATSTNSTTDSSSNTFTVTNNGSVQWSGSSPYNQTNTVPAATTTPGSVLFNGTTQYFSLTPTFSLATATTPFTMEAWVYFTAFTGIVIASTAYAGSGHIPFVMGMGNGQAAAGATPWFGFYNGSAWVTAVQSTTSLVANTWYHLAYVYTGSTATIYANGTSIGTAATAAWQTTGQAGFYVGRRWDTFASVYYSGYISNFRFVNGTAVYTAAFSPPMSPLTAIANTVVLLNTASSGTLTTDSSSNNYTVTNNGTATYSSLSPFTPGPNLNGAGSVLFNGTSQYLSVASNAAFALGTGNFTIECWFYSSSIGSTQGIYDTRTPTDTANAGYDLFLITSKLSFGTAGTTYITGVTTLSSNTWYHVAVTRSSTTVIQMFLNGVQEGSTYTASVTQNFTNNTPRIGLSANGYFNGYITNLRVIKGTALYTSTFNVPTKPLTTIGGTSLLMNTSAGGRIFDVSSNGFAITNNATATYSNTVTPLPGVPSLRQTNAGTLLASSEFDEVSLPAGAIAFNGTSQYLSMASNAALNFSTGDFTVEAWVYPTSLSTDFFIISSSGSGGFFVGYSSTTTLGWGWGRNAVAWDYRVAGSATVGQWQHVAVTRSGTSMRLFVNGVQVGTTQTIATAYDLSTTSTTIGSQGTTYYLSGYISNLRVVKGVAVYTVPFTPPQTVLPSVTNTSLLLNVINSTDFITDSSPNNFTVTNTGTAIWTPQGPYNQIPAGAIAFTVKTQFVSTPTTASLTTFTGDFTFECWVYPTDVTLTSTWGIWDSRQSGGTADAMLFTLNPLASPVTGSWRMAYFNGSVVNGTSTVFANQWTHVAWVRSGTTMTFYVNGVAGGTATVSGTQTASATTNPVYLGSKDGAVGGYGTVGSISNFRIVNGTAVYTSNFTVPTVPLTAIANTALLLTVSNSYNFIKDSSANNYTMTNSGTTWTGSGPFNP